MLDLEPFLTFKAYKCQECGFEHYRANAGTPAPAYSSDADYVDDLRSAKRHTDLLQWHHRIALRAIEQRFPSPSTTKCLDYGAFNGFFVRALLDRGFDAFGCEINAKAVEFGCTYYGLGDRLRAHDPWANDAVSTKYDLISLFEVLEHVPDPGQLTEAIYDMLNPNGLLIISTPNKNMLWRPPLDYPPHHLSRFSPTALRGLIEAAGFQVLQSSEQMSAFDLMRHYIGNKFRNRKRTSMRGGQFRAGPAVRLAKGYANRLRPTFHALLSPFDKFLYWRGYRYISQLVIATK